MAGGRYKQAEAFLLLRDKPMNCAALSRELGISTTAGNHVLTRLKAGGYVANDGKPRDAIWHALRPVGPCDKRGFTDVSMANLAKGWEAASKRKSPICRWQTLARSGRGARQLRREGTSSEIPQIPSLAALLP